VRQYFFGITAAALAPGINAAFFGPRNGAPMDGARFVLM
jgi:hypothetical protein